MFSLSHGDAIIVRYTMIIVDSLAIWVGERRLGMLLGSFMENMSFMICLNTRSHDGSRFMAEEMSYIA